MSKRTPVTQADMKRAIKAATQSGLTVRECVMSATQVRLIFQPLDVASGSNQTPSLEPWPELSK